MQDASSMSTALGASEILTLFFVTLGPVKLLAPFLQRTRDLSAQELKAIAARASVIAAIAIIAGGLLGQFILARWKIPAPVLMISAGLILFVVALRQVLQQYDASVAISDPLPASPPMAAASRIAFPLIITPYGIAAVIVLLAESSSMTRTGMILGLLVIILCLDLLAMSFARRILTAQVLLILQIFGAVLAVLQVALAINFVLIGWRVL
jgi:multiple antibiotic resistance protein